MALPKHILVLNAGIRPVSKSIVSDNGDIRLHFRDVSRPDDVQRLRGMVFDDVVWVRRLPWDSRYREEVEFAVNSRIMRRENGT